MPMAGDSPTLKQEDIEELLRQAQLASGAGQESATAGQPSPGEAAVGATGAAATATVPDASVTAPGSGRSGSAASGAASGRAVDDVEYLLAQAEAAVASVVQPVQPAVQGLAPFELKDLAAAAPSGDKATLELLKDVDLDLRIELGRTQMYLEDVLKLKRGSVVTLDKLAGDPVDVFVNGRLVARGEVLVLNDNFCVRVTELLTGDDVD
jgi:flagellar motor switch protein FliN/FliY